MRHIFVLFSSLLVIALAGCTNPSQRTPNAPVRDAYVLLSGGGTPLSNNYSQYVQAKAIAEFFARECPPETTWVFFGAGNRDGAAPEIADVRRVVKGDGVVMESWIPGSLPHNRPASRASVLRALREEILPVVHSGGTLYLFVGDHGEIAGKGDNEESAITLWQLKRGRRRAGGWWTDENEILGVAELRQILAQGLGAGRVVFCMTQCHSGGFHDLGLAGEPVPPREWFVAAPPAWGGKRTKSAAPLRVAGFTATDLESPAAGCVADPSPESWAGYERYWPERLFGRDLLSGHEMARPMDSFAAAHEAATLVDRTIDKPRATSEHFLARWANVIETRLASSPLLSRQTADAVAAYRRVVETGQVTVPDPLLREREAQFRRFIQQLALDVPTARELLVAGTRQQLEMAQAQKESDTGRAGRRGRIAELRRTWTTTLRPAWKDAVLAGSVRGLEGAALAFEKHLLALEDDGQEFLFPRGGDDTPLLNELYWESGYAHPATMDRAEAEAVARWGGERRARIVAWGAASGNAAVRAAAARIGRGRAPEPPAAPQMSRATAVERVLFYRRVLAAWEFLIAMDARDALAELHRLIEVERTPLRRVPAA